MKIGGDEVELVTDFAQLRSGMIVWAKPCRWCGGQHRAMLTRFKISGACLTTDMGVVEDEPRFELHPASRCSSSGSSLSARSVAAGIVYRVVDPLLSATTVERKRELVRP